MKESSFFVKQQYTQRRNTSVKAFAKLSFMLIGKYSSFLIGQALLPHNSNETSLISF